MEQPTPRNAAQPEGTEPPTTPRGGGFDELVGAAELREIRCSRKRRKVTGNGDAAPGDDDQLLGLSLSGGGIRSATFGLGVLQGLAALGILRRVDYLSTVSGGGYAGSWLVAWLRRAVARGGDPRDPFSQVEKRLARLEADPGRGAGDPIRHLREYSNYLTPRASLLGADTAHAVAVVLRNLVLNQLVIGLALLALLAAFYGIGDDLGGLAGRPQTWPWLLGPTLVLFLLAVGVISYNLLRFSTGPGGRSASGDTFLEAWGVRLGAVLPFAMACWLSAVILWQHRDRPWDPWLEGAVFLGYGGLWLLGYLLARGLRGLRESGAREVLRSSRDAEAALRFLLVVLFAFLAGLVGGGLLFAISRAMARWEDPHLAASVGGPLVAVAFIATLWLHVGLSGRRLPDEAREWTARLVGTLALWSLAATVLFAVALHSDDLVGWLRGLWDGMPRTLAGLWAAISGAVAWAGRRGEGGGRGRRLLLAVAPYVFLLGLLVLLAEARAPAAEGVGRLLEIASARAGAAPAAPLAAFLSGTWGLVVLSALMSAFLSWRVDINEFSLHSLYRNRLVRAYLGASNPDRDENPWTDFDPRDDDADVSQLRIRPDGEDALPYVGPYPLLNTTLNLAAGTRLAWQRRKAASFFFAPLYSGFRHGKDASRGFRPTDELEGGVSLGRAMAISGAAASPNMGHFTTAALAALMTLFNVRLGVWLGNPGSEKKKWPSAPRLGLFRLVSELMGNTNEDGPYVYLSDGGHFENLGLYELVRRRCRFIVAVDAEQDAEMKFGGLGTAIELCRTDFGVEIDIDVDPIRPDPVTGKSVWHCAIGRIGYDEDYVGTLVYLKSSLTGDEPADVQRYAARDPAFPHQSTADQWFDETQFESYRALGKHVAESVFGAVEPRRFLSPLPGAPDGTSPRVLELSNTEDLFVRLRERWYPPHAQSGHFSRHGEALSRITREIRTTRELRFLEGQIHPEWRHVAPGSAPAFTPFLPDTHEEFRQGFHLCAQMIQLMENVYLDLDLETGGDHPDHRGWMNLFRQWAASTMFQVTWAVTAATYGARFRDWCRRELEMRLGAVEAKAVASGPALARPLEGEAAGRLTRLERRLVDGLVAHFGADRFELWGFDLVIGAPEGLDADGASRKGVARFPFGFALVRDDQLHYFRVREHLRSTGLGRDALMRLCDVMGEARRLSIPEALGDELRRVPLHEPITRRQLAQLRRMLDSVYLEIR